MKKSLNHPDKKSIKKRTVLALSPAVFLIICNTAFAGTGALVTTGIPSDGERVEQQNRHVDNEMENDTLFVHELLLARDVVEREPVDVVDAYTMDDSRAWCFVRIHNSQKMQDVYFEWYHEDEQYFRMNSKVGISENWRTYSSVGLQPGQWRVLLRDRHGEILAEQSFEVSE